MVVYLTVLITVVQLFGVRSHCVIDINIGLSVLFILVHSVKSINLVVSTIHRVIKMTVMPAILVVRLLVQVVQDGRSILLYFNYVFV